MQKMQQTHTTMHIQDDIPMKNQCMQLQTSFSTQGNKNRLESVYGLKGERHTMQRKCQQDESIASHISNEQKFLNYSVSDIQSLVQHKIVQL